MNYVLQMLRQGDLFGKFMGPEAVRIWHPKWWKWTLKVMNLNWKWLIPYQMRWILTGEMMYFILNAMDFDTKNDGFRAKYDGTYTKNVDCRCGCWRMRPALTRWGQYLLSLCFVLLLFVAISLLLFYYDYSFIMSLLVLFLLLFCFLLWLLIIDYHLFMNLILTEFSLLCFLLWLFIHAFIRAFVHAFNFDGILFFYQVQAALGGSAATFVLKMMDSAGGGSTWRLTWRRYLPTGSEQVSTNTMKNTA